jgi:hypothetical protein
MDISELQMSDCSFEKGAPAMNLLKYEEVEFINGDSYSRITIKIRYRIKIFNSNGFKHANIVIPYESGSSGSKITDIEGATYNIDEKGRVKTSQLNKSDLFKDKSSQKDGLNSVRFTFPDVKDGSIIEYSFTRTDKDTYFIPPWYFQDDIPTLLSASIVSRPLNCQLQKRIVSTLPVEEGSMLDQSKGYDNQKLFVSYAMRNIPSFKYEPFMSSSKDYKQRIDFAIKPNETLLDAKINNSDNKWHSINSRLLGSHYFGWQFIFFIPNSQYFIDSASKLSNISQKINAVYSYVKTNLKWNNYYSIFSSDLPVVWNLKEGTSAEINLSILNLLRKCGVTCYPILFSTRSNGKTVADFPSLSQFNTVDVLVFSDKGVYVLDGTNKYLPFNIPPLNVMNREGMIIIDANNNQWYKVTDDRKLLRDSVSVVADINRNGIMEGTSVAYYYDLAKIEELKNDQANAEAEENKFLVTEIKTDSTYSLNKETDSLPLIKTSKFHYELPATNDFYFLNPFTFFQLSKNPFIDSIRNTDLDFGANTSHNVHMEIVLPKEFKLEDLNSNKTIQTADSSLSFKYTNEVKKDTIVINSTFEINKSIFESADYKTLVNFFQNTFSLLNNQILLRKKEE